MKIYKLIGIMLLLTLTILSVQAEGSCYANETCTWYRTEVPNGNTSVINFIDSDGTRSIDYTMTLESNGVHYYSNIIESTGNILGCTYIDDGISKTSEICESKTILDRRLEEEEQMIANAFWVFILLIFNYAVIYRKWKFGGNLLFITMGFVIAYLSTAFTQLVGFIIIVGGFINLLRCAFIKEDPSKKDPIW